MRYDTLLLDADGTLLDFERSEKEAFCEALASFGVTATEEMVATYSAINDDLWKQLERGEILRSVLLYRRFELFFERYGIRADAHEMAATYMRTLTSKGYVLEGADALCERLSKCCRLYIVTNGTEVIQNGRLADSGLLPYLTGCFVSEPIGYNKPSEKFFEYVAEHIPSFSKEKTMIVGDSLSSDILGGIGFGIDTCWYNPKNKKAPVEMDGKITYTAKTFDEILACVTEGEIL